MMAVLMLLVGSLNPSVWALWTMGLAVASRDHRGGNPAR